MSTKSYDTSAPDASTDKSLRVLFHKLQEVDPSTSEMIKTANVSIDYDELDKLPDTAFAWPEFRKYAMHTKHHAVISSVYALGATLPNEVTDRLEKAAAMYGIDVRPKDSTLTKTASTDEPSFSPSDHLIVDHDGKGGMCKVASAQDVKLGIEFITRNRKMLSVEKIAHAHKVIYDKSQQLGLDVPSHVSQAAGLTVCDREKLAEWVETRACLVKDKNSKCAEAYEKLASAINGKGGHYATRNTLLKTASVIANLDQEAGLTSHYFTKLPDPMQTVFNTTKVAEESLYFGGQNVPFSKFLETDPDIYAQVLGDDVIEEITTDGILDAAKLRDVLVTLPADLQVALVPFVLG